MTEYIMRIKNWLYDIIVHKLPCNQVKKHLRHQPNPPIILGIKLFQGEEYEWDNWELNHGVWGSNYYYSQPLSEEEVLNVLERLSTDPRYRHFYTHTCWFCCDYRDSLRFRK